MLSPVQPAGDLPPFPDAETIRMRQMIEHHKDEVERFTGIRPDFVLTEDPQFAGHRPPEDA